MKTNYLLRRMGWALALLGLAGGRAGAQPRPGKTMDSSDQTMFSQPAPLSQLQLTPGNFRLTVHGAGGHLAERDRDQTQRASAGSEESSPLVGVAMAGLYAIDDRFFVTGGGLFVKATSDRLAGQLAGGTVGGGLRIAGGPDDRFILGAVLGLFVARSTVEPATLRGLSVTGTAIAGAVQAEIVVLPWLSVVPYANLLRLVSVSLDREGIGPTVEKDLAKTLVMPGLDVWIYTAGDHQHGHFSLGGNTTLGQQSKTTLFTLGHTFSFGGGG